MVVFNTAWVSLFKISTGLRYFRLEQGEKSAMTTLVHDTGYKVGVLAFNVQNIVPSRGEESFADVLVVLAKSEIMGLGFQVLHVSALNLLRRG